MYFILKNSPQGLFWSNLSVTVTNVIVFTDLLCFTTYFRQLCYLQAIHTVCVWSTLDVNVKRNVISFLHTNLVIYKAVLFKYTSFFIEINREVGGTAAVGISIFVNLKSYHVRYLIKVHNITLWTLCRVDRRFTIFLSSLYTGRRNYYFRISLQIRNVYSRL